MLKMDLAVREGLRPYEGLARPFSTRNMHSPSFSCSGKNHPETAGCFLLHAEIWLSFVCISLSNLCLASLAGSPETGSLVMDRCSLFLHFYPFTSQQESSSL